MRDVTQQLLAFSLATMMGVFGYVGYSYMTAEETANFSYSAIMPPDCTTGIGGTVFHDLNFDGINNDNAINFAGIEVRAYDASNTLAGMTTTDANGEYSISGTTAGVDYRIEFTIPSPLSDELKPTQAGTDNGTLIQFAQAGMCINIGIADPDDYCQAEPKIVTSCYAEGDQSTGTDVLISFDYTNPSSVNHEALSNQIGSTYGLAYHRHSGELFAASFMKRFSGFGPGNSPASIYMISSPDNGNTEASLFVDLDALAGAPAPVAGADVHDFSVIVPSNEILDANAYDAVGKSSFGDMDISEDELSLWVINLFDQSLYEIPLGTDKNNPVAPTAFSQINVYPMLGFLPDLPAGVVNNEIRPFALKVQGNLAYVGLVTSGEDGGTMRGLVYTFDMTTSTTTSPIYTKILDFPLNYARGCGFASPSGCAGSADWNKWETTYPEYPNIPAMPIFTAFGNALEEAHPQPMITDIEFDAYGNMILGMRDRLGDQMGYNAPYPTGNQLIYPDNGAPLFTNPATGEISLSAGGGFVPLYYSRQDAFGDILKADKSGNTWSVNIANHSDNTQSSGTNAAGILTCPDSENTFGDDCYHADGFLHEETAMGGLAVLLRENEIVTPSMDPAQNAFSNGIDWFDASSGNLTQYFEVLTGANSPFGKAYGLGEIEFICDLPSLQIGNYVWEDTDNDGIQDADETGIDGVTVELIKDGNVIATTQTANGGQYYFKNATAPDANLNWTGTGANTAVLPNMTYTIQISNAQGANIQTPLNGMALSETNVNSNNDDRIDSDGSIIGDNAAIVVTTGEAGIMNHALDFGFTPCNVIINAHNISSCLAGNFDAVIDLNWENAPITGNLEYSVDGGAYQQLIRTNFSANATNEMITIPNLVCNETKEIMLRFEDATDCFEQLVFLFPPADPAGYFYCVETGEVILGGSFTVTPPPGGSVSIGDDGSSGYYSWLATGSPVTEGLYTMNVTAPAGYTLTGTPGQYPGDTDDIMDPTFGSEDNPSSDDPLNVGTDVNVAGTHLPDFSAASNPFFLEFDIELSDPFVDLNNIPLTGCAAQCGLNISATPTTCTDDGDGTYSATYDVTVDWTNSPSPAEDISVTFDGGSAQTITTTAGSNGSQTVQFTIDADGTDNHTFAAEFVTTTSCNTSMTFKAALPCVGNVTPDCANGVAGTAYHDMNTNGENDDNAGGIAGVQVNAYDCDGNLVGTTYTDAEGEYQIPNTVTGEQYRIEFVLPAAVACDYKPTNTGADNQTDVVFTSGGTCINFGLVDFDYEIIPSSTPIGTLGPQGTQVFAGIGVATCGVIESIPPAGRYSLGFFDFRNMPFDNNRSINNPPTIHHSSWLVSEIGNVFGIDIDDERNVYVTASTHFGYGFFGQQSVINFGAIGGGDNDLGAAGTIYKIDKTTGQATVFAQLPQQAFNFSHGDCESGLDLPRTTGPALGNIVYDSLHHQFFVSNFEDGMIYRLDNNGTTLSTFDPFLTDNGSAGFNFADANPYGLAISPDYSQLYFGTHDVTLNADVWSVNLDASGDFSGAEQFHVTLQGNGTIGGGFAANPWICISDLHFNPDGRLVAAVRTGCENNFATSHNHGGTYYILDDSNTAGTFDNIHDNPRIHYPNDPFGPDDGYGGVAFWDYPGPGYEYIITNADIREENGPHGIMMFPHDYTTTGNNTSQYILRPAAAIPYIPSLSGADLKGVGGDVAAYSKPDQPPLPIEIGNYVWIDENENGIQDACEVGIENLEMQLYDAACNLVGVTTTDATGNYQFNETNVDTTGVDAAGAANSGFYTGLSQYSTYYVTAGNGAWNTTDEHLTLNGILYDLTTATQGTNTNIDSDAVTGVACTMGGSMSANLPTATIMTEGLGCSPQSIDFGFHLVCPPVLTSIEVQQSAANVTEICLDETVDLKLTHSANLGDIAVYSGASGLDAATLYDYANHAANGISAINANITPAADATMTTISDTPTGTEITYYFILADGNTDYEPIFCVPMDSMTLTINPHTPTASVDAGPHDLCSEDSPYVATAENVIDLQNYITSGETGGIWSSADAPAGALVGSTFTATQAMESTTYNFVYTIPGTMSSPALCADNTYPLQITVTDCYASIGDTVWEDTDGDGTNDETGTGVEGIKVTIYECNAGVKGAMVAMDTTDANGAYNFDLLPPNEYCLEYDLANSPNPDAANFTFTNQNSTFGGADDTNDSDVNPANGCTDGYTLTPGDEEDTADAGLYTLGKIGDLVFEDTNANGIQDASEAGIANVDVTLTGTDGQGNAITPITIQTDGTGMYMFGDLPPGDYVVTFTEPAGYETTGQDDPSNNGAGDNTDDSDADPTTGATANIPLTSGDTIPTIDAGYYELASIGNYVWEDENANGIQEAGEDPIENVTVTLTGTDGLGNAVSQTTTTDVNGLYSFTDLVPGDYKLTFTQPAGYEPTANDDPSTNGAADDTDDSDADVNNGLMTITTTLDSGEDDDTWDAGFYIPAKIGDIVFEDTNANGVQDAGEPGIENVTVTLTGTDGLGNPITPIIVQTDATGMYMFGDLIPGDYVVTFTQPTDYEPTANNDPNNNGAGDDTDDSDADPSTGATPTVSVASGDTIPTIDAGYYELASIGNYVWEDENANGIQEAGENPIENVMVTLTGTDGLGNAVSDMTTTDANGLYNFTDLVPGDYKLTFTQPAGYTPTANDDPSSNGAGADADDSDAEVNNGLMTITTTLESGEDDLTWDAGFYILGKIGDVVFEDENGNGVQEGTEIGIANVDVTLTGTDGLGNAITPITIQTDGTGMYMFGDLVPGDYVVTFTEPAGYETTFTDSTVDSGDDTNDSDADITTGATVATTLTSGDTIPTIDAGYYIPADIGDTVWEDTDGDGVLDAGENGIENVTVTLTGTDGQGNPITPISTTTDANGNYSFEDLPPGDYTVTFTEPTGYETTYVDSSTGANDDTDDSDADPTTGASSTYTLTSGDDIPDVDAGFYIPAKIGDYVWEDENGNGVQEAGENPIENVTVTLNGTDGQGNAFPTLTTTTDATGMYMFGDLAPGDYTVTFTEPAGYETTFIDSTVDSGDDTNDSDADVTNGGVIPVNIASGDTIPTIDAGYYVPADIGDLVFEDVNGNGVQDAGEPGIENVVVTLTGTDGQGNPITPISTTTDPNGNYSFEDLPPGEYVVTVTTPTDYTPTYEDSTVDNGDDTNDSDIDPNTGASDPYVLTSGDDIPTVDAGFFILAELGDYVWEDENGNGVQEAGENPIENVTVTLTGTDGQGTPITPLTTTTDATGFYNFEDLVPGDYVVTFTEPAGYETTFTDSTVDNGDDTNDSDADVTDGMSVATTIISGDSIPTIDAGYYVPADIGNYVWEDTDGDGVQDAGEPGIENVVVTLTGTDGQGNPITPISTTTDANGEYNFEDLPPGDYVVVFSEPNGYEPTYSDSPTGANDDTDDSDADPTTGESAVYTLTSGDDIPDVDAGFYIPAKIGDYVWEDENGNGVQEAGENPIAGVDVTLTGTDGQGNPITPITVQTDATGMYMFGDLLPGDYVVTFTEPAGYETTFIDSTVDSGDDANDSDADVTNGAAVSVNVMSGDTIPTIDAGYYVPADLGDFVWEDSNANGVQDAGEPGIENVTITLTGTDGQGNPITPITTISDSNGNYTFEDLPPGEYVVTFTNPTGYTPTFDDSTVSGGDDTNDSDADPTTGASDPYVLTSGDDIPTIDAGFYIPAKIGDYVWEDENGNGVQEAGENPIAGVDVTLTGTDGQGNPITPITVQTDATGMYMFGDLVPGDYVVTFTEPAGYETTFTDSTVDNGDDTNDSDADETTGASIATTVASGDTIPTIDAGYYVPADIGNYVWEDTDGDGVQEVGEPGIENVVVTLTGTDGQGNPITPISTTTDANGEYLFEDLPPGEYVIVITEPTGYTSTFDDSPTGANDDTDDSDIDPNTGESDPYVLTSGDDILLIDAGFVILSQIGDYVWEDENGNGVQEAGENPIENVTVTLTGTDGQGNPITPISTTTDANGAYLFDDLIPGDYVVTFTEPTGYETTFIDSTVDSGDDTNDSDADVINGGVINTPVASGDTILTIDAGYYVPADIGDLVFEDTNGNGVQDAGEPGIENVVVTLTGTDGQGNPITPISTTTDPNGNYSFEDLPPGEYVVTVTTPTDYTPTYEDSTVDNGDDTNDSDIDPNTGASDPYVLTSGDDIPTVDAGFFILAELGDYVWEDENGNGVQEAGENPIAGVDVTLTGTDGQGNTITPNTVQTDATGMYMFDDLVPGDYVVTFTEPAGYETTFTDSTVDNGDDTNDSDADVTDGMSVATTIISGDSIPTIDAGYYVPADIGNYVWEDIDGDGVQDAGEPGIEDVTVTLTGADGQGNPITSVTTTTDTNGEYLFNDLPPGEYIIVFNQPMGYVPTFNDSPTGTNDDKDDSDINPTTDESDPYVLTSGDDILDIDGGYVILSEIGDYVWEDANGNGVQDTNESGIEGVDVTLTGTDGQGNPITPITIQTDATGMYIFGDLIPGDYVVTFTEPMGYETTFINSTVASGNDANDSDADVDNGEVISTNITSGDTILTIDAGYYIPAAIGDLVWEDVNGNGVQEIGEPGIENVIVTLTGTDGQGNSIPSLIDTTDANGNYLFEDLPPGFYVVTFTNPVGYTTTFDDSTVSGGNETNDSDVDPTTGVSDIYILTSGNDILTIDAGYFILSEIGDFVWDDTNGNGVQDAGEPGIAGVDVTLTGTDGQGNPIVPITVQTDANGGYIFGDLVPGEYTVTFDEPNGFETTAQDSTEDGGNDTNDNDADETTGAADPQVVISGDTIPTIDAGYYVPGKIGDLVWQDYNANGIQDAGEPGIEGVEVTLTGITGLNQAITPITITTDSNGMYMFGDLWPGDYEVTFMNPADFVPTGHEVAAGNETNDNDADPNNNLTTETVVINSADTIPDLDGGFYAIDFGDAPDSFGTTEGNNGASHVINPDKYLGAGVDAELDGASTAQATGDNDDDSAFAQGTVTAGNDEDGINFITPLIPGYEACVEVTAVVGAGPAYLTGWIDFNGNGEFDANEQLAFTAGIDAAISMGTSTYCFPVPVDASFEGGETHARFRLSCNTGVAATGFEVGGEVEDYYIPFTKVGNLVWQDVDNEGDQDELAEYGLNDIVVELHWAGIDGILGNGDDVTFTDTTETINGVDGKYCFHGLTPGDYEIEVPNYPQGFQDAPIDATGDDTTDNDGNNILFTITSATTQPTGESSTGDEPGATFPDTNDDLTFDIGLVAFDYGDLPEDFVTLDNDGGAYHVLEPGLFLGDEVDPEFDGNPDAEAGANGGGDNDDGQQDPMSGLPLPNDEEGFKLLSPLVPGYEACMEIKTAVPSGTAYFKGWIDFNGDGDFAGDADEALQFMSLDDVPMTATDELAFTNSGTTKICFDVPAAATFDGGETHLRFRFGRDQGVTFDGQAAGGEVEDYWLPMVKVGNLVWREYDEEGDQDEAVTLGLDGVEVQLIYAGLDNDFATADDNYTYTTTTALEDGVNGKYNFCGLPAGEYEISIPIIPADMIVSPINNGSPITDADDPASVQFVIADAENQFVGENGTGDDAPSTFPDDHDLIIFDFAFSAIDMGDLPDDFNTTAANAGAYHVINPFIYLGAGVDAETDGAPNAEAGLLGVGGDNQDPSAIEEGAIAPQGDEDGIEFISPMIPGEKTYIKVTAKSDNNNAVLNGWIDYDGDGVFAADGSEQIVWTGVNGATTAATTQGAIPQGLSTQIFCYEVPTDATFDGGETHIRMRLSSAGNLPSTGKALDGEVEDYWIPMVKVGNLVWRDINFNGFQDAGDLGINDVVIILTTQGEDGILGTADDLEYQTTSANVNGQDGFYQFCGLPAGDYTITSLGDGSLPTEVTAAGVPDDLNHDGDSETFTINFTPDDQVENESGIADNPGGAGFPDNQDDLTFDFGYLAMDYGDLPNTFATTKAEMGAGHGMIPGHYLGDGVDMEADGIPDQFAGEHTAGGDNTDPGLYTMGAPFTAGDDEDGIQFTTPMIPGQEACVQVKFTSTDQESYLNAWIDFNGDDTFAADGSEAIVWKNTDGTTTTNKFLEQGTAIVERMCFDVPTDATFNGGETHIRFRMSFAGNLQSSGTTVGGEVEDYWLPFAKIGNYVWEDRDLEGDQNDDPSIWSINDFPIELVYAGVDGDLTTINDNTIYETTTAQLQGQDGKYNYCGLIDGTYEVRYTAYPDGMVSAIPDHTNDDDTDSDGISQIFTISGYPMTLPTNENSVGDTPNGVDNFPDVQDNWQFDFAFVQHPQIRSSMAIAGVDFAPSGTCGNFEAIFNLCFDNPEIVDLNNLQATLNFSAPDAFGTAFVGMTSAPEIISSTATTDPILNPNFNGNGTLFNGTSGLIEQGQEICVQFRAEISPQADNAPINPTIQATLQGGAVNDSGVPIPDLLNGLPQAQATDLSDDGYEPATDNPNAPGNTSNGVDDPTPLTDCWMEDNSPACNDNIQISLDENGEAFLDPAIILEGENEACGNEAYPLGGYFRAEFFGPTGGGLGSTVTCDQIGETYTVMVSHVSSCNPCWGTVTVEDKLPPVLTCSAAPVQLPCNGDPSLVPGATAIDNCDANPEVHIVDEIVNDDNSCDGVEIIRTYIAYDEYGNESNTCSQVIEITPPNGVTFPADIAFTCEQYAAHPNILDVAPLTCTGLLPNPDLGNSLDATGLPINAPTCLSTTGAGNPDIFEGTYCNYAVETQDDTISTCGNSFKILRTWTVIDWCTGDVVTLGTGGNDNTQIIKVLDITGPQIVADDVTVSANVGGEHPSPCLSTEVLPAAAITDNCNGIAEVQIFTPVGTIFSNGGAIPEPGLGLGQHIVTYQATDECNNVTELNITVNVVDDITPTAVCDEITQVSLSTDGFATVNAETFDDGSHDNCGLENFEVRRMTAACGIAGNTNFNETVTFCCADIGQEVMVTMRVYDAFDNFNDCMVQVLVEDKLPPYKVQDVDNQTINCDVYYNNLEIALDIAEANNDTDPAILNMLYNRPVYNDNCDTLVTSSWVRAINSCGEGTITRTWNAIDPSGNAGPSCTQTITVEHVNDWEVAFPADVSIECEPGQNPDGTELFGEPQVFLDDCEILAFAQEDVLFNIVPDACYKIIRTWTVINWCVYDGVTNNNDDILISQAQQRFRDGGDGIIRYQQHIKIVDEVAPEITCPIIEDYSVDSDCLADITLPPLVDTMDCSPNVTVIVTLTDSNDNVIGQGYNYNNLQIGNYTATYIATDNCGNNSSCQVSVNVVDHKPPTPYCVGSLVVELIPVMDADGNVIGGMIDTWASDFDAGSFDNCSDVTLSVWLNENNYTGSLTLGSENNLGINGLLPIHCDSPFDWNFGTNDAYLYVTDAAGNVDFCVTTLVIESNPNVPPCDNEDIPVIAGNIQTEDGVNVGQVEMLLNGSMNTNMTTEADGNYEFDNLESGGDYTITPHKDVNPLNGVTTYDLVLIRQHILTTSPLNSPYQLIAADVNNSGSITTYDIVQLRQLILFVIDDLPNNTSWRFVAEDYQFSDENNPWANQFDEVISYNNLMQDELNANFIGIKVGDVNGSVQANQLQGAVEERKTGEVIFQMDDLDMKAGEEYEIRMTADRNDLLGYQFTLEFDQLALEFVGIGEGEITAENFGLAKLDEGLITTSWDKPQRRIFNTQLDEEPRVIEFSIIVKALTDSKLSEVVSPGSRYTKAEAYGTDGEYLDVLFGFGETLTEVTFELMQNTPNPFRDLTTIGFHLPEATRAELSIHDATGKELKRIEQAFVKGYNEVTINRKNLEGNKVVYYTLKTPTHTATRSMIVVE